MGIGRPAPPKNWLVVPVPKALACSSEPAPRQGSRPPFSTDGIGGYLKLWSASLRSRFHLSACGWALTAPHGDPIASHATVIKPTARCLAPCATRANLRRLLQGKNDLLRWQ